MKTKEIYQSFSKVQNKIIKVIAQLDTTSKKKMKKWKHSSGGGGLSCEILGNKNIEKAAVNFSSIVGDKLPSSALGKTGITDLKKFKATGVSVIIHPTNPKVPCAHMNIRFFEASLNKKSIWWFGGGFDLTPYFINKTDVYFWRDAAKDLCGRHKVNQYKKFSMDCDNYFFLPHRNEPRGIGGIFFDQLNSPNYNSCKLFCIDCADTFISSFASLFKRKVNLKFTDKQKEFQLYRRGRYVEFNLLFDRGTLFGLQSGGRAQSILMSLPPSVTWNSKYNFSSYEKELLNMFALARKQSID